MLIRGALSGAILGFATTLAFTATVQSKHIVGSLLFPVGFVMIMLFGIELVTGNFMVLPVTLKSGKISTDALLKNWIVVFTGNFIGSLFYAFLYSMVVTDSYTSYGAPTVAAIKAATAAKTLHYADLGALKGFTTCFFKAILCNWMVCMGVLCNMVTSSVSGKVLAMWLPVLTFFGQGFEHLVVNMFLIPCGMMLGAEVSIMEFIYWNLMPVILGNIIGGSVFVGFAFLATFGEKPEPLL